MKTRSCSSAGKPSSVRRGHSSAGWGLILMLLVPPTASAVDVSVPDAEAVIGAPAGRPVSGEALDRTTQAVSSRIRCPVCQGLSVADSPSEMAVNMKAQVRALIARGYTQDQVERYFEHSYGQFVLLRPKFQGINVLVWILPIAALAAGMFVLIRFARRLQSPDDAPRPAAEDDSYIARVRTLVKEGK